MVYQTTHSMGKVRLQSENDFSSPDSSCRCHVKGMNQTKPHFFNVSEFGCVSGKSLVQKMAS